MREGTFRAAGGIDILLERSWTVTDIFALAEAPSQLPNVVLVFEAANKATRHTRDARLSTSRSAHVLLSQASTAPQ